MQVATMGKTTQLCLLIYPEFLFLKTLASTLLEFSTTITKRKAN